MMWRERADSLKDKNYVAIARYEFAAKAIPDHGFLIADAACGMGYGTHMLHDTSHDNRVVGMDCSQEALTYAAAHYPGPAYILGDVSRQTFAGFDVLV